MVQDLSPDARREAASRGEALPDGSYPIRDCDEVKTAVQAYGRETGSKEVLRRHIVRRAIALGCTEHVPDEWSVDVQR